MDNERLKNHLYEVIGLAIHDKLECHPSLKEPGWTIVQGKQEAIRQAVNELLKQFDITPKKT